MINREEKASRILKEVIEHCNNAVSFSINSYSQSIQIKSREIFAKEILDIIKGD